MFPEVLLSAALATSTCSDLPLVQQQYEMLAKFNLEDLGTVDTSRKTLNVSVEVAPELTDFKEVEDEIFSHVKEFYSGHGVDVALHPSSTAENADSIAVMVVPQERMPEKYENLIGASDTAARIVYLSIDQNAALSLRVDRAATIAEWWQTVAHEIGHQLSLYHTSADGALPHATDGVENLMKDTSRERADFSRVRLLDLQRRQIHSFLSKEKAYTAVREAGDFKTYDLMVRRASDIRRQLEELLHRCR